MAAAGRPEMEPAASPPDWLKESCSMGIDEAGRGPVLGPMVYACACCPTAHLEDLKAARYADSKTLTDAAREQLLERIRADPKLVDDAVSLSAKFISSQMLGRGRTSLNAMAADATHQLIQNALDRGMNLQHVYVDTVGDSASYASRLGARFPGLEFTVCPKADALYPIVSAASIVAKVTRDRELASHRFEEGVQPSGALGSGYPGDPATKEWLATNCDAVFGFPSNVRFSWQTAATLMKERCVNVVFEADEDASAAADASQRTLCFGKAGSTQSAASATKDQISFDASRHPFFRSRRLQQLPAVF